MASQAGLLEFASPYHLTWFLASIGLFAVAVVMTSTGRGRPFPWLGAFHVIVAFEAFLYVVIGGNPCPEVYSVHCIWFNGLMTVIYLALYLRYGNPTRN